MTAPKILLAGLALSIGILLNSSPASAQTGTVQLKGKWYSGFDPDPNDPTIFSVNELKAKCKDVGTGPQLFDGSVQGERKFTLHFHADCFVFADACQTCASGSPPPSADMVFTGQEVVIEKNGNPKPFRVFSGVLTEPVLTPGSVQGAISAKMKCSDPFDGDTCSLEKGTFTYSRIIPDLGGEIRKVFIGKYKAKFPGN